MPLPGDPHHTPLPLGAITLSLILHGLILFAPLKSEAPATQRTARLEATLAPQAHPAEAPPAKPPGKSEPAKAPSARRILSVNKGKPAARSLPKQSWTPAEKAEMNHFLDELADQARRSPPLAQRSLAMARTEAQAMARRDAAATETIERVPNGPPPDPFSLEMYMDAVVKKLNRSAAFVKNDPRSKGVRTALVRVRLYPSGSLRSFDILNAADQHDEIAFVKSVVERAVPFAAFPADLRQSVLSLGVLICIRPSTVGDGAFRFSRNQNIQGC